MTLLNGWILPYGGASAVKGLRLHELFGSFFLGAFDKYVEILCYFRELFQRFGSIRKLLRELLTNFETSKEVLCYFLKTPEFGRSPKIPEPATPLNYCTLID